MEGQPGSTTVVEQHPAFEGRLQNSLPALEDDLTKLHRLALISDEAIINPSLGVCFLEADNK